MTYFLVPTTCALDSGLQPTTTSTSTTTASLHQFSYIALPEEGAAPSEQPSEQQTQYQNGQRNRQQQHFTLATTTAHLQRTYSIYYYRLPLPPTTTTYYRPTAQLLPNTELTTYKTMSCYLVQPLLRGFR